MPVFNNYSGDAVSSPLPVLSGYLGRFAVDPTPTEGGQWWYNYVERQFKFYDGSRTYVPFGSYTKTESTGADEFGRPNVNPPTVVDQDNLTLYRFTLNTDRLTAKFPVPYDLHSGGIRFSPIWTNDGGVDDQNRYVRWQLNYQIGREGSVVSGNHANSPKQVDDLYTSALGWVEHHTGWMEIAAADFQDYECMYVRLMAITPPAPALTCEPHLLGICRRYTAWRIPI